MLLYFWECLLTSGEWNFVEKNKMKRLLATTILGAAVCAGATADLNRMPIVFEKNTGYYPGGVQYLNRAGGMQSYFTKDGVAVALNRRAKAGRAGHRDDRAAHYAVQTHALHLEFPGARPLEFEGEQRLAGVTNYLIGDDPGKWRTEVPNFGRIRARNVYSKIDLTYYGNAERRLEYDFVVQPGGDPGVIRLRIAGADWMRITGEGDLRIETPVGSLLQTKPVAYQTVRGVRVPVPARYVLHDGTVGIDVAEFNRSAELIIDPAMVFSTYLGGSAADEPLGITLDSSRNVYVTGLTTSTNFPVTAGALDTTYNGNSDIFVAKLNPAATAIVYATYIGGSVFDVADAIRVDGTGSAIIGGETFSSDIPTTAGVVDTSQNGGADGYIAKLNPTGTALTFATFLGGSDVDSIRAMAIDGSGSIYVTGLTSSSNFPTTGGAFDTSYNGDGDVFVTKLNSTGTSITYSTYLGGATPDGAATAGEIAYGIAVNAAGNAYLAGSTGSVDFPVTGGVSQAALAGIEDGFVSILNSTGTALVASTYLGGATTDRIQGMAIDSTGAVYVAGETDSTNFPTTAGSAFPTAVGDVDCFVTKLNASLTTRVYSTYIGGTGEEREGRLAVDSEGSVVIAGVTASSNFPISANAFSSTLQGAVDSFVARLNPAGSAIVYSTFIGGSVADQITAVTYGPGGSIYATGLTNSTNFPTTAGVFDTSFNGGSVDGFVFHLNLRPTQTGASKLAAFKQGLWIIDRNGNFAWDGEPSDWLRFWGGPLDTAVMGDWNGDGRKKLGVFHNGQWLLDMNGNGIWEGPSIDKQVFWGSPGDIPVVGNWNGLGNTDKIGVFNPTQGRWLLDFNGNFIWDGVPTDRFFSWGSPSDIPVVGDWNGSGTTKVGIFNPSQGWWLLDYNGNFIWEGVVIDRYLLWGSPGDVPVPGDWNGNGTTNLGVFNPSQGVWVLDRNGSYTWDGPSVDGFFLWGSPNDIPVVGDWGGTGFDKVGVFNPSQGNWVLDINGNLIWDGFVTDRFINWGQPGDTPKPAAW
jgi:hypothetical protein